MASALDKSEDVPSPSEVRTEVERMAASEIFRSSPQLAAFLRFVVEAVLGGQSGRIKGYTIGVEVLRRDVSFDPQLDPIVRVEATRLRRAIERYYAGPGAGDDIVIDLPRGGYVPLFRRRKLGDGVPRHEAGSLVVAARREVEAHAAPGHWMPTLRIAPFVVFGTPQSRAIGVERLSGKLSEQQFSMRMNRICSGDVRGLRSDEPLRSSAGV